MEHTAPLRDTRNAKRARMLLIRQGPIYPRHKPSFWKLIKAKFRRGRHRHDCRSETILDELLHAVSTLRELTTLDVYIPYGWENPFYYSVKLRVIQAGWSVFAANLTTLRLEVRLEDIHLILLPHVTLLRLENLSLTLHLFNRTSKADELIQETVLPFLIDHGSTLRSLELRASESMDACISSFLTRLQHMPYLNRLDICQPIFNVATSLAGHHQFLEAHRSQLHHLSLFYFEKQSASLDLTDELFNQEWSHVTFPELQSLSFNVQFSHYTAPCEAAIITYIQRLVQTVKSLELGCFMLSYDGVVSILTGPKGGEYQLTKLGMLDLHVSCFSPALLGLLAKNTPQLQSLTLTVFLIGPDERSEMPGKHRVPEFCGLLQPSQSEFSAWGLHELQVLGHLDALPLPPSEQTQCKVALLRAFPKLQEVCVWDVE